jgi:hypothetical protein
LQRTEPSGFRYATFQLHDGVTFLHLSSTETGDGQAHPALRWRHPARNTPRAWDLPHGFWLRQRWIPARARITGT